MKKGIAWVLSLLLLLSGMSAYADGVLIMATNPEFQPFEYMEGNQVVGFDVDLAMEIAKDLGLELQIEAMAFDAIIAAIEVGKADVGIAGMSITEERLKTVDFSVPYFNATQICIVKAGSEIAEMEDLYGKLIGVQLGTTGDIAASELSDKIERYQKGLDAILDLRGNKLDAVILDKPVAESIVKALNDSSLILLESILFEDESYAIAIAQHQPELLESINNTIARIYEDGTIDTIISKYFGD
jgi:polar amino acid transport system substrate-binding protein